MVHWWRRRNRGVGPSQLCYRTGFGASQSQPTPAQRSWFCANQRTLNRQPVYGRDSFGAMSLCILHRLLRWVDQQRGAAGNRGRRKRDRGDKLAPSFQRYYMTGHRFMTTMDLLERAALLSAFQMTLHLPSWREVTAARAWHCPSSRYGADLERVREHTRLDLRVARESKVCQACKVHVRLLDYEYGLRIFKRSEFCNSASGISSANAKCSSRLA